MKIRAFLSVFLVVVLAGCGDDPIGPNRVNVDGSWSGTTGGITFTMAFEEQASAMTGSGSLSGPGGNIPVDINGTRAGVNITLSLSSAGFEPIIFTGEIVSGSRITGRLNDSGFPNVALTLSKDR